MCFVGLSDVPSVAGMKWLVEPMRKHGFWNAERVCTVMVTKEQIAPDCALWYQHSHYYDHCSATPHACLTGTQHWWTGVVICWFGVVVVAQIAVLSALLSRHLYGRCVYDALMSM